MVSSFCFRILLRFSEVFERGWADLGLTRSEFHPPEAGPNVKLSHPERGYEFGVAHCCRTGVRATLAAKRVRVGCSALFGQYPISV